MLTRLDAFILEKADAFILWIWNRFEIPRVTVLRVLLVSWVIVSGSLDVYHGSFNKTDLVLYVIVLLAFGWEEYRSARYSPERQNADKVARRYRLLDTVYRLVIYALLVGYLPYFAVDLGEFAVMLMGCAYIILLDTLTPVDPPKRKTKEKASRVVPAFEAG